MADDDGEDDDAGWLDEQLPTKKEFELQSPIHD